MVQPELPISVLFCDQGGTNLFARKPMTRMIRPNRAFRHAGTPPGLFFTTRARVRQHTPAEWRKP
jgi:hypothetical protein